MDEIERLKKLEEWYALKQRIESEVKPLVEREAELRAELAEAFFPNKVEGTRTHPLSYGWAVKVVMKMTRKIDEAVLPSVAAELGQMSVSSDKLVAYKPSLVAKEYKSLKTINPEAAKIFDKALIISWGAPTMEMVPPPAPVQHADQEPA